jgi:16S rRNA processing protein RimM
MNTKWYTVGKLVNTQGIHGEVRIISHTDFPEIRFAKGSRLILFHPSLPQPLPLEVTSYRTHKNFYIVKFDHFDSIDDVEKFKEGILKITEDDLLELEKDEFYVHQIIGCRVVTEEGEEIGEIKEVLSPGANDVWVVKRPKQKDLLLPYIDEVITHVDIEERKVTIHLIDGLLM